MDLEQMISLLDSDLQREATHWHFYFHSSMNVSGLFRHEIKEFLVNQAKEEMNHIDLFSHLIIGLGGKPSSNNLTLNCPHFEAPREILNHACMLEEQVVSNYVQRIEQAQQLYEAGDKVNGKYIEVFLEDQIMHSRYDLDEMRTILRGLP